MAGAETAEQPKSFWSGLTTPARAGLLAGAAVILAAAAGLAIWSSSTDYQVLFTHLSEGDAAGIVEQLKHQKIPYRLADSGATIKVPAGQVYETRLALVSGGVPLSGGVGFEIFDRQGFGATEQSQRVEYQRALQGELARTIDAIDSVKSARVHLVMPENTMFKRDREEARAAVSLILKPGTSLTAEQTAGIQRLVAASVSGLDASKVVITDQRGITLAGADPTAAGGAGSDARLAIKRDIEEYLTHKVASLLDRAFGTGQALVSVNVTLNFDEIKSSVQDLVPWHGGSPTPEGAVTHRRQVETGGGIANGTLASDSEAAASARPSGMTSEVEYEYGHHVEQVIAAPGSISRLSVGVIVPGDLSDDKKRRISDLVRMAAGINEGRGDAVVVQPLDQLGVAKVDALKIGDTVAPEGPAGEPRTAVIAQVAHESAQRAWGPLLPVLGVVFALLGIAVGVILGRRRVRPKEAPLSVLERQRLLRDLEQVLRADPPPRPARTSV
jgi:flagellar M-ring protein FliF